MRTNFAPRLLLPVGERDHLRGPANAPVTLVEYGDYQCPYCGLANPIVDEIRRELGDGLRFVFSNFTLIEVHPHAEHAAEIAEAAGAHHKFWEMHDMLYAHQQAQMINILPNMRRCWAFQGRRSSARWANMPIWSACARIS